MGWTAFMQSLLQGIQHKARMCRAADPPADDAPGKDITRPVSKADLALMRRIDELHLDYPFAGSRMLRDLFRLEGIKTGRQHVATLMKRMSIEAIYRKPDTSKPEPWRSGTDRVPAILWAQDLFLSPP
jgi:putative transposase